jgi:hypothetical protein
LRWNWFGVRALLRSRENATAVYYGPQALAPTKPGGVLQPIDTPLFSKREAPRDAAFALWWATPDDPLFVRAINEVSQGLNIKTVAECVEDVRTLNTLRSLGVDYVQGYLIGRPMERLHDLWR